MFELDSAYLPAGDQPQAIEDLAKGLKCGTAHQTLLGVTGSGKTFTIANVIQKANRPTLILSHNKTLAAQLYAEFKGFFPNNAIEYFVSYFDYYQPEAYVPQTDTFIEKDSSINDEIERMRLSTMSALFSRRDVIVIASVSCIYGIGSKQDYEAMLITMKIGDALSREQFLKKLIEMMYERNDVALSRGAFRVRGDVIEMIPGYLDEGLRVEFFGNQVDRISRFEPISGKTIQSLSYVTIHPSKQFVTSREKMQRAILTIRKELCDRIDWFEKRGKLLEAQRIKMRTEYDLEMMEEMGFCSGIENYSRHISGRPPGSRPHTLMDFFPKDYLMIIDESHVTIPQIGGMYAGDHSRKSTLVKHGFRLPSALDNRPLDFEEFQSFQYQTIYVSATPAERELAWSGGKVVEQIVRPTGLLDPEVEVKPLNGQIDDLINEAQKRAKSRQRVLVTTLTKRTAEELTDYLSEIGVRVRYLHSEIDAIERVEILRALRKGDFDVLVGINLLREGLDLPEVSLVAILDADKEGYLRSTTSLIQTAGRAARHISGKVILYADVKTRSIRAFLSTSKYRRQKQLEHNRLHNITPQPVRRAVEESLSFRGDQSKTPLKNTGDLAETIRDLEEAMILASSNLQFEKAALLRDQIRDLKKNKENPSDSTKPRMKKHSRKRRQRVL